MKNKKWIGLIVAVLLCILAIPAMGLATEETYVCQIVETGTSYASIESALENVENNQTIKLIADLDLSETIKVEEGQDFILDLNGHILDASGIPIATTSDPHPTGVIFNDGKLKIVDSAPNAIHAEKKLPDGTDFPNGGILTGGKADKYTTKTWTHKGGGIFNNENAELVLEGGTIINNSASYGGGIRNDISAKLTINGAVIKNNKADTFGGGIDSSGDLIMIDGEISGNTAYRGGGINRMGDRVIIQGGKICNNTADSYCGGIDCTNAQGAVIITGGEISGNTAAVSGGVGSSPDLLERYDGQFIYVGGDVVIQDNTCFKESIDSNIDLSNMALKISSDKPLTNGAKIAITNRNDQKAFATGVSESDKEFFSSDLSGTIIERSENGELKTKTVDHQAQTYVVTARFMEEIDSLYYAIYLAKEGDTITFDGKVKQFGFISQLPTIYQPITIDGGTGITVASTGQWRLLSIKGAKDVTLKNITFVNGESYLGGGAINIENSEIIAENCIFKNNSIEAFVTGDGGAICAKNSTLGLNNCLFYGNQNKTTKGKGGAIALINTSATLHNCTIVGNSTVSGASAISFKIDNGQSAELNVYNSIIVNNTGTDYEVQMEGNGSGHYIFRNVLGTASKWNSVYEGESNPIEWDNNLSNLFVKTTSGSEDYHIKKGSQAHNAGNKDDIGNLKTDLDGKPRVMGTNVDLGCYEFGYSIYKGTIQNGSITIKNGNAEVNAADQGDNITVVATPNEGYRLDSITMAKDGTWTRVPVNNNQFTMPDANVTVYATFKLKGYTYDITKDNAIEHGSIIVKKGQQEVQGANANDTITVISTPDTNYKLEKITVFKTGDETTTVEVGEDNTFKMPSYNVTVSATFEKVTCKNVTTGKEYAKLDQAIDAASANDTIDLVADTVLSKDTGVPKGITINLKGFDVDIGSNSFHAGDPFILGISCEKDLNTAAKISEQSKTGYHFTWKLTQDITVSKEVKVTKNFKKITVDGNGKTITASRTTTDTVSESHVLSFTNLDNGEKSVEIKNLTLNIGNGFRSGICFHKSQGTINATLDNVAVSSAVRSVAPKKEGTLDPEDTVGTLIQNNGCKINVKTKLDLTTDQYCWAAMDLDAEKGNATLTVDDAAGMTFSDNRDQQMKEECPVIKCTEYENTINVSGKYITDNMIEVKSEGETPILLGYDLKIPLFDDCFGGKVNVDGSREGYVAYTTYTTSTNPYKTSKGYDFTGWFYDDNGTEKELTTGTTPVPGITYYAKYTKTIGDTTYAVWTNNVAMPATGENYLLDRDVTLSGNWSVPANTKVALNGHQINGSQYFQNSQNLIIVLYNETDLQNAATIIVNGGDSFTYNWLIGDSFTVAGGTKIEKKGTKLNIDGNGKTITASNTNTDIASVSHVLSFTNSDSGTKSVEIKDLTLKVGNGFRSGICFHKASATINATLDNVAVSAERTIAPKKSKSGNIVETDGALIQNNGCTVNVKTKLDLTTDQYCWAAVDMDAEQGNATLTVDDAATMTFNDHRTDATKIAKPIINCSENGHTITASGKYITDYMKAVMSEDETPVLRGYNPKVTVTFDSQGGSEVASEAIASYTKATEPEDPEREHYTFGGWYEEDTLQTEWDFTSLVTQDMTLYAKWDGEEYNITYHLNDGSWAAEYTAPSTYTFGIGETLPIASNLVYEGYTFDGWYDNAGLSGSKITVISATDSGDKEFYAKWTAKRPGGKCIYTSPVEAGQNVTLILKDTEAGTFDIERDCCSGYQLKQGEQYLSFDPTTNTVKMSDQPYTWSYDGGLYATTCSTGKCFWWFFPRRCTKHYLTVDDTGKIILSEQKVEAKIQVTADEHSWIYLHDGDGKHQAACVKCQHQELPEPHDYGYDPINHQCICGKIDPQYFGITDVRVLEEEVTVTKGCCFWKRTVKQYQYTIIPMEQNVRAKKVEYSKDQVFWNTGRVFRSDNKLGSFHIRITDSYGKVTTWFYNGTTVAPEN